MKKLALSLYNANDLNAMKEQMTNAIQIASGNGVALDMKTRKSRRKLGAARHGYINLILPIAINNINVLPRDKDPKELLQYLQTIASLAELRGLTQKMAELINDTHMALGIDAVLMTDSMAAALQNARRSDNSLDSEMAEVDRYNSRFAKQMEEEDKEDTGSKTPDTPPAA